MEIQISQFNNTGLESNASNFLCHAVYDLYMSTFRTSPLQLFWRHYFSISTLSTDFFPPSKFCFPSSAATQSRCSEVPHHPCSSDVCQRTKQMKVWWCGVWTIGLMRQHGPSNFVMVKEAQHLWHFFLWGELNEGKRYEFVVFRYSNESSLLSS
jgi:hypothetical protein